MEVRLILIKNRLIKSRDDRFLISKGSIDIPGPGVYSSSTLFDPRRISYGKFYPKIPLKEHIAMASNPGVGEYSPKLGYIGQHATYQKIKYPA